MPHYDPFTHDNLVNGYGSVQGSIAPRAELAKVLLIVNRQVCRDQIVSDPAAPCHFYFETPEFLTGRDEISVVGLDAKGRPIVELRWGEVGLGMPISSYRSESFNFPNFFIMGAAKCGTTSLHSYLSRHPDVCMSMPKEPFYFEIEYQRGAAYYFRKYFGHWNGEPMVGESRHRNMYLPYVAGRIFHHNPTAKLIFLLRQPTLRAISHWWHWRSRNLEPLSLREALAADLRRIQAGNKVKTEAEIIEYAASLDLHGYGHHRTYLV